MIDVDAALAHLSTAGVLVPEIPGAPPSELTRSPAAAAVARLSGRDGLMLFHFEHRAALELPEGWVDPARAADAALPEWLDGVLPEPKYQSFRHDLPIGSYHPGHRAKWATHELCHALVGFAWRPGATPLFHATAARLAELVPVVLWYFLDEVGLRRCPRHEGPLFRTFCRTCEAAASLGPVPVDADRDRARLEQAARFLDQELAAVARTLRLGRPCPHVWGSLDLCSDGLAYAQGHGLRLASEAMALWAERFGGDAGFSDLEALQERAIAVARGIAQGEPVAPWFADAALGRARWIAGDLAARLLQVREDCDDEVGRALLDLVDALAAGGSPADALRGYRALHEDVFLPDVEEVFALGYDVADLPTRSVAQIAEGLKTVTPLVLELAEDAGADLVAPFVAADRPARVPLGERFAAWLEPGPIAELARYEAALRSASGEPEAWVLGGAGEGLRLLEGARVLRFAFDPVPFAEQVEAGEVQGLSPSVADDPVALVIARDGAGELLIVEIPVELADSVTSPATLPDDARQALTALGLLVPERWT